MIALDTNILVYARRQETSHHTWAKDILKQFAEGEQPWALPWPCIYEFIHVVTHPRVFDPPAELESALDDLDSLLQSPSFVAAERTAPFRLHAAASQVGPSGGQSCS